MSTDNVENGVAKLQALASKGQIKHIENIPQRPQSFAKSEYMPKKIQKIIAELGIHQLYTHQAQAIDAIFEGCNVVVSTPTASGKSLIFNIPVLEALISHPKSRAIFLFPLKALARDQLETFSKLMKQITQKDVCFSFDGDTPEEEREKICKYSRVIFTNPDILHQTILPHHKNWAPFFSQLKFIVLDEAHVYRGVFGSHVGCIIRRLLRISRFYKSEPMMISASATIANPKEHLKALTGLDFEVISESGAPQGGKTVVFWEPPEVEKGTGKKRSVFQEAADVVAELVMSGVQTLCFVEARKLTEIVTSAVHERLRKRGLFHLIPKVESYRAGYNSADRIKLEKAFQKGTINTLIATNALELGINIGDLDATVHVGLPSTASSLWQQMGRAGRKKSSSVAVILPRNRPVDSYFFNFPKMIFQRTLESVFCNPSNPHLLRQHLPCAAREIPLKDEDSTLFGGDFFALREELLENSTLVFQESTEGEMYRYRFADIPAIKVSIRGISPDPFLLVDLGGKLIEEVDSKTALKKIHPNAIFYHQRSTYEIISLDLSQKKAIARETDCVFVTEPMEKVMVQILEEKKRIINPTVVSFGKLLVSEQVVSFTKKVLVTDKVLKEFPLELPPSQFDTTGFWLCIPPSVKLKLPGELLFTAILALKNLCLNLLPSFTMCDFSDINGLATLHHEGTEESTVFIYDSHPGGVGITQQAFSRFDKILKRALEIVEACKCPRGCPGCIQIMEDPGEAKDKLNPKLTSVLLLEALTGEWMYREQKKNSEDKSTTREIKREADKEDVHFRQLKRNKPN